MIKSDNGEVVVYGRREDVLTDLAILLRGLREGGAAITDDEIAECVKVSKMTDKEVDAEKERLEKRVDELVKELSKLCSGNKPKKSGKAVVVSVDADTPTEDVAKQISEVVAKTVREMLDKNDEE
jgi:DNA-binding FrmR family transcriptional regulator